MADPVNAASTQPANVNSYTPETDGALQSQADLPQGGVDRQQPPVRRERPGQGRPPQKQPPRTLSQSEKQFVLDQFKNPNADLEDVLHRLAEKTKTMDSATAALFIASAMEGFNRYRLDHKISGQPIFFSQQSEQDIEAIQDHVSKAGGNTINPLFSLIDTSIERGLEDLGRTQRCVR
jgi:hypothetical protein